jgi:putative tricarboxylic transport membrane protein
MIDPVMVPLQVGEALAYVLTPTNIGLILLLTVLGILMGALPGMGQVLALALFFPFTLTMAPERALMLMGVLYGASTYGGAISAILINVPGTPSSMATLLDGHPLTKQGRGAFAIGVSTTASFFGGVIGLLVLAVISPLIARFAATLGSHEIFWLTMMGFATVSAVAQGSIMKSLVAVTIGVMFASVGTDPVLALPRYTFGTFYLQGGLDLVVILVGMFSIPQVIEMVNRPTISETGKVEGRLLDGVKFTLSHPIKTIRGALIGTTVGSIPGVGATAANFISYLTEVTSSSDPDSYGKGNPKGLIAAETANNGSAMGSLVPAFALAIPGSATAALFIGAMIVHGITPGVDVFEGTLPWIIYISIFIGAIMFLTIGILGAKQVTKVTTLPNDGVLAGVVVFALVGSFAVRNNPIDVFVAIGAGLFAYFMMQHNYSIVAFVLAFVLAPISEQSFLRALRVSAGDYGVFFSTPLAIALALLATIVLLSPFLYQLRTSS